MKRDPKIHLPCGDPWSKPTKGEHTECGRRITPRLLVEHERGIEFATCEPCRNMRDFGVLVR